VLPLRIVHPAIHQPSKGFHVSLVLHCWHLNSGWAAICGGTDVLGLLHPLRCPLLSPWAFLSHLLSFGGPSVKHWHLFDVVRIYIFSVKGHEVGTCEVSDDSSFSP
jgi:hypothetical protein